MDDNSQQIICHLSHIERAAQDLLESRQDIVNLDRKRNQTREARTAIKSSPTSQSPTRSTHQTKTWMCFGNMFMKMPNDKCLTMLDRSIAGLDSEINSARDDLRGKLNTVRDLEGKSKAAGFDLQALPKDQLSACTSLL